MTDYEKTIIFLNEIGIKYKLSENKYNYITPDYDEDERVVCGDWVFTSFAFNHDGSLHAMGVYE